MPNTTSNIDFALTVKGPLTDVRLTATPESPQPAGTTITLTAAATGGTAPVQFKWWVLSATGWTVLQDWSTAASVMWTPATANPVGIVEVWARSAGALADAPEKYADLPYAIQALGPVSAVTVTADRAAPQLPGTTITLTAAATGGTAPVQFKWWVYSATGWTVLQDWSAATSVMWTPATANVVGIVEVWARSAGSLADAPEQYADLPYAIRPLITAVSVTADRAAPQQAGTTITLTAAATGGAAPVQFKWWVYGAATGWTMLQDWSPATSAMWTPATANPMGKVEVWARSAETLADAPEKYGDLAYAIESGTAPTTANLDAVSRGWYDLDGSSNGARSGE